MQTRTSSAPWLRGAVAVPFALLLCLSCSSQPRRSDITAANVRASARNGTLELSVLVEQLESVATGGGESQDRSIRRLEWWRFSPDAEPVRTITDLAARLPSKRGLDVGLPGQTAVPVKLGDGFWTLTQSGIHRDGVERLNRSFGFPGDLQLKADGGVVVAALEPSFVAGVPDRLVLWNEGELSVSPVPELTPPLETTQVQLLLSTRPHLAVLVSSGPWVGRAANQVWSPGRPVQQTAAGEGLALWADTTTTRVVTRFFTPPGSVAAYEVVLTENGTQTTLATVNGLLKVKNPQFSEVLPCFAAAFTSDGVLVTARSDAEGGFSGAWGGQPFAVPPTGEGAIRTCELRADGAAVWLVVIDSSPFGSAPVPTRARVTRIEERRVGATASVDLTPELIPEEGR